MRRFDEAFDMIVCLHKAVVADRFESEDNLQGHACTIISIHAKVNVGQKSDLPVAAAPPNSRATHTHRRCMCTKHAYACTAPYAYRYCMPDRQQKTSYPRVRARIRVGDIETEVKVVVGCKAGVQSTSPFSTAFRG